MTASELPGSPSCESCDVLLVVITYNSAPILPSLLASLPPAMMGVDGAHVVVVDNASDDDTVNLVTTTAPWVHVLVAEQNLGYAGGVNLALRSHVATSAVVVLNPDAVPAPGCFAELLRALDEPRTGITVPRVVDDAGRLKYSLRREPTLLRAVGEGLLGGHRAARWPSLGEQVREATAYGDGATADWASGAAMCVASRVLDAVGLWDERFFLYSEETEFALRARDAGFLLRYVATAEVRHPGGDMERSSFLWSLVTVNKVRLYELRHGRLATSLYWLVVLLTEMSRAGIGRRVSREAVRALLRTMPSRRGTGRLGPGGRPLRES